MSLNAKGEDIVQCYTKVIILWRNSKINKFKAFNIKLYTSSVNNEGEAMDNLESCLEEKQVKQDIRKNNEKNLAI